MTKADLVNELAKAVEDLTKKKAAEIVDALFETVQGALAKGDKVQVVGFGTFEVQRRAARQGRNPQDPKKTINIPAKNVPVFRAGKALKDLVNKSIFPGSSLRHTILHRSLSADRPSGAGPPSRLQSCSWARRIH